MGDVVRRWRLLGPGFRRDDDHGRGWLAGLILALLLATPAFAQPIESFSAFLTHFEAKAVAAGVSREVYRRATEGLTPDPNVPELVTTQPEFTTPMWDYIEKRVSAGRIERGKQAIGANRGLFETVGERSGVDPYILGAIWGMETDYGAAKDRWDVFRSLATLAFVKYRHPYFRNELMVVMRIMQDGHIARDKMVSSWAGAMGQTQFMPSNFVDYAIDFSRDGRTDIWNDVTDVLGSTANYLHKWKWKHGLPWGFEVTVPKGFDMMRSRASFAEWQRLGVRRADGRPFPATGNGILFFPSGANGPAFIATENFDVLKEYNNSDAYAIAVGHLADRMQGGLAIKAKWPADDRPLSRDARIALQKKLSALGYKVNEFEGHIDFDLRDNIRAEQKKLGIEPDGNPTPLLLERLGVKLR